MSEGASGLPRAGLVFVLTDKLRATPFAVEAWEMVRDIFGIYKEIGAWCSEAQRQSFSCSPSYQIINSACASEL